MNHFFAYIDRMRYIERWALMRNSVRENIQVHKKCSYLHQFHNEPHPQKLLLQGIHLHKLHSLRNHH